MRLNGDDLAREVEERVMIVDELLMFGNEAGDAACSIGECAQRRVEGDAGTGARRAHEAVKSNCEI